MSLSGQEGNRLPESSFLLLGTCVSDQSLSVEATGLRTSTTLNIFSCWHYCTNIQPPEGIIQMSMCTSAQFVYIE